MTKISRNLGNSLQTDREQPTAAPANIARRLLADAALGFRLGCNKDALFGFDF
jgi:hypothetical protein